MDPLVDDATVDATVAQMPPEIALPRENGEILFTSPWEARVFGLAVALNEQGAFAWKQFSETLAEQIAKAEQEGESSTYYERWLRTLHLVTTSQGLLAPQQISDRSEQMRIEDDHGHDHDHPHEHHHHYSSFMAVMSSHCKWLCFALTLGLLLACRPLTRLADEGPMHTQPHENRRAAIWAQAKLDGVDFRATGNEPGWKLEITEGRQIRCIHD